MPEPAAKQKILIVDDEEQILRSTQMLLEVLGYEAVTLRNWKNVHEVAAREHPDLILQDLKMPGIDLTGTVRALREDPVTADIPIVLFSASPDIEETAQHSDAAGILNKPFREEELLEILDKTLPLGAAPRRGWA